VASLALLPNVDSVHQDEDEWVEPWTRDVKILHIELRRWGRNKILP
jgi:phosphopantothenoylcysteine decarboxylase